MPATPTTGTAMREKRFTTGNAAAGGFDTSAASGASAPIQKATPMPCRKIAGRVSHSGGAVAACPVMASDRPTPTKATIAQSARAPRAAQRQQREQHRSDGDEQRGPGLVAERDLPGRHRRERRQRQVEQIEPQHAKRHHRARETDRERHARNGHAGHRPRDPARKEHAADADEQAEIDTDPRQPDQHVQPAIGVCGRLRPPSACRSKRSAIPRPDGRPARSRDS